MEVGDHDHHIGGGAESSSLTKNEDEGAANNKHLKRRHVNGDYSSIKPSPLGMKEWIVGALHSMKNNGGDDLLFVVDDDHSSSQSSGKIVCSHEYLSCALKIAHSLADHLSAIEEQRGYHECDNGGVAHRDEQQNQQQTRREPHHGIGSNKSWSSRNVSITCGLSPNQTKCGDEEDANKAAHNQATIDYLNVQGAIFIAEDEAFIKGASRDIGKMEMIHWLGITFVELFSGGQIIIQLSTQQQQQQQQQQQDFATRSFSLPPATCDINTELSETTSRRNTNGWLSLPSAESPDPIELESAKAIIDALGEGDELFGTTTVDNEKNNVAESTTIDETLACGILGGSFAYKPGRMQRSPSSSPAQKKALRTQHDSLSVDSLRSLELPTALCDLMSNMIENNTEDFHNNEAYQSVTDVRDDLKMMLDSPEKYLHDLDIAQVTNANIQLETTSLCGREAELEALKKCYHRSITSECEVAMICGASGIGKTALCREFAEYATARSDDGNVVSGGVIYLSGSFDRLQKSRPFHAIGSAFDNYCTWLSAKDQSTVEKVSSALKEDIGKEIWSLAALMPNLSSIVGTELASREYNSSNEDAVDAQKRLRYLFCQFVKVISKCHNEAVVLFLDDSQWIDSASAALLNQLLMMSGSAIREHRFFFFGCYRDDEMNETHPLTTMLSSVDNFGIKTTTICLTSMSKDTVNEMVSTTLSLLPRITRPLANILHHRTKGSPLFVKQLMIEMNRQHYLYPSLTRRRWVWEANKIRDMKIPESIATFILNSFNRLPAEVLLALCSLSCFGSSADVDLIGALEVEMQQSIIKHLDAAVAESVLDKRNHTYYFVHDKLQEAAYSVMKPEERCHTHFRYGLSLARFAMRERDDKLILIAAGQLNLGGPNVVANDEQEVEVAKLNLDAGKQAMKMSDFFSAYSFFDYGISYLRKGHWETNYYLSLELFNLAAMCAIINAEHGSLKILLQQIIHYAKSVEDKFQAISISIMLRMGANQVAEAIKIATSTLMSLGEDFPKLITPSILQEHLVVTKKKLVGISDDTLLSYPMMADPLKIKAMEMLEKLFASYSSAGYRTSLPVIASKMVQLSLANGLSNLSPVGFAHWGNYLALVEKDFEGGYHYAKLALSLMRASPSCAHDGAVLFYTTHTKIYVEPFQSTIEYYLEGHKAAMRSGATQYAMLCQVVYDMTSFWTGKKVDAIVNAMRETIKQVKFHNHLLLLTIILPVFQVAVKMTGGNVDFEQSGLINASDENSKERDVAGELPQDILRTSSHGFYEALIFRDLDKAKDSAETFWKVQNESTLSMSSPMFMRDFYFGLVSFWIGREMGDKSWITRGSESKYALNTLATKASAWNFENKAFLLQAEEQYSERNFEAAEILYDCAILSSKQHKFLNEEALANELAGHFFLDTGRRMKSIHYFSQAFQKYSEWGAFAKASMLTKYVDGSGSVSS